MDSDDEGPYGNRFSFARRHAADPQLSADGADRLLNAMVKRLLESEDSGPPEKKSKSKATVDDDDDGSIGTAKDAAKELEPEETVAHGMLGEYKPFYQHRDKDGRLKWTVDEPDDVTEPIEGKATAKYAFLVRLRKSADTRKKYDIDSIIVQSPLLKQQLGVGLANYPGITTTLDRLVFQAPFKPFVHRWQRLLSLLDSLQDADPAPTEHLKLFMDLLYTELKQAIDAKVDMVKNGVITFDYLWTIFEPEILVYGEKHGQQRVWELQQASYGCQQGVSFLGLNVWHVDWDGSKFGQQTDCLKIWGFDGTRTIQHLDFYPLNFHLNKKDIVRKLVNRGKLFAALAGYHYKLYAGVALGRGGVRHNITSRVIIDCDAHNRLVPNQSVNLDTLSKDTTPLVFLEDDDSDESEVSDNFYVVTPASADAPAGAPRRDLSEKELLLTVPYVCGFALKTKTWLQLFVDQITEIKFNENAFDKLVLPERQKSLINAFVKTQARCKTSFDDIIAGKGQSMIMLLAGPPGVGKTLTAESVSENLRVPLYTLSAGDLGLDPTDIEKRLSTIMDMTAKWNAVLLLDEADVFLEARSVSDLERNKLVSIFLRMLEYYEGILFLTTNRIANIDDAFHSRIHLTCQYPKLSQASRKHVWQNFLGTKNNVSEEEVDELSKLDINGRIIKNVLKTAMMFARSEQDEGDQSDVRVNVEHVRTVLAIEQGFE